MILAPYDQGQITRTTLHPTSQQDQRNPKNFEKIVCFTDFSMQDLHK